MKIVYFGTPHFAAEVLKDLLLHKIAISAVVTQPDRPKGRSLQLAPSPVKIVAEEAAIPIFQPEKCSETSFLEQLIELKADLFVVVAFGQILPQKLLDIPPLGSINIHASLLPKYRGAAPIQRAIMGGETETGIAIQKMVRQLDAGDVVAVSKVPIPPDMTFGELEEKLIEAAKPLLRQVIREYTIRIPEAVPQNHAEATYASKIELAEGEVVWSRPAAELHNLIRAFSPKPGAWCWIYPPGGERKRLKILRSEVVDRQASPGEILSSDPIIGSARHSLKLLEVQPEGKKGMRGADWFRGQKNILFAV